MVTQVDFMLAERCADGLVENRLAILDLSQRCLDLLLQTLLEVELVERA